MDLSAPISNLTSSQKDQLMSEVKQQIAVANAQELLTVCNCQCVSELLYFISNFHVNFYRKSQKNASRNVSLSPEQV